MAAKGITSVICGGRDWVLRDVESAMQKKRSGLQAMSINLGFLSPETQLAINPEWFNSGSLVLLGSSAMFRFQHMLLDWTLWLKNYCVVRVTTEAFFLSQFISHLMFRGHGTDDLMSDNKRCHWRHYRMNGTRRESPRYDSTHCISAIFNLVTSFSIMLAMNLVKNVFFIIQLC